MSTEGWLQLGTLTALILGFVHQWFREGRARGWQLADAKTMAEKVTADALSIAETARQTALAVAAKANSDAVAMAKKVLEDAERVADKVNLAAEKLVIKVAEGTITSTDASKEAALESRAAAKEANNVNKKIEDLNGQLLILTRHIQKTEEAAKLAEKDTKAEHLFNERVKAAVEDTLARLNGSATKKNIRHKKA